nr:MULTISPECIES: hypothetical protein [unclassified Acidithiobacillus]
MLPKNGHHLVNWLESMGILFILFAPRRMPPLLIHKMGAEVISPGQSPLLLNMLEKLVERSGLDHFARPASGSRGMESGLPGVEHKTHGRIAYVGQENADKTQKTG